MISVAPSCDCMRVQKKLQTSYNQSQSRENSSTEFYKVEKILKGSLDSIPSPSPFVKIQITGGKV